MRYFIPMLLLAASAAWADSYSVTFSTDWTPNSLYGNFTYDETNGFTSFLVRPDQGSYSLDFTFQANNFYIAEPCLTGGLSGHHLGFAFITKSLRRENCYPPDIEEVDLDPWNYSWRLWAGGGVDVDWHELEFGWGSGMTESPYYTMAAEYIGIGPGGRGVPMIQGSWEIPEPGSLVLLLTMIGTIAARHIRLTAFRLAKLTPPVME